MFKLINNQASCKKKRNNCQGWGKAQYLVLYYFIGQRSECRTYAIIWASISSWPSLLRQQVCLNRARLALCERLTKRGQKESEGYWWGLKYALERKALKRNRNWMKEKKGYNVCNKLRIQNQWADNLRNKLLSRQSGQVTQTQLRYLHKTLSLSPRETQTMHEIIVIIFRI